VHHVVELTAAGRIVLAGLRLAAQPEPVAVEGERGVDVPVSVGRRDVAELLGEAWQFARWRFLRGHLDEDVYWRRRAALQKLAKQVGVELVPREQRDEVAPVRRVRR
jgi:hypothetical protein